MGDEGVVGLVGEEGVLGLVGEGGPEEVELLLEEEPAPELPDAVFPIPLLDPVSLFVLLVDALEARASNALPRMAGSSTICCRLNSTPAPPGNGRRTFTVTFHRLAAVFCSQSSDQLQAGSSSRGASLWD